MDTATSKASAETVIRQAMENWEAALRAKDIDKMMTSYSPDIVVFGATPPMQYKGVKEYRKKWEEMFDSIQGPIGYETRDVTISTHGDIAFSHLVNRIKARTKDGDGNLPWVRITLCFRKIDGKWLVTHEHASVPFDPETGKAALDLNA